MLVKFQTKSQATITMFGDVTEHSNEPLDPQGGSSRGGEEGQIVSIAHRVSPLIEMLTAAAATGENLMWDK